MCFFLMYIWYFVYFFKMNNVKEYIKMVGCSLGGGVINKQ